jgi:ribosome biogenesis GTPase
MGAEQKPMTEGRVVAGHGRRFVVETDAGARSLCLTSSRSLQVVCGDRVHISADHTADPRILEVLPRSSLFSKADDRGRAVPAAANLDQVMVVHAPLTASEPFLTDKYLASIEGMGIAVGLVFNKLDLAGGEAHVAVLERLDYLAALGYPLHRVSTRTGTGMEALARSLLGKSSLLVGQSGVGKSSLLNALVPEARHRIDELSAANDEGRHTTTATTLHPFPGGGALLDSPGVRDLALAHREPESVASLFRDFRSPASRCRFGNCLHLQEPGCGVKAAVESGGIPESRYTSYRWLMTTMRQAKDQRYD